MIGIITFYDGTNYGTTLQALALQKAIISLGFDNEVIDYVPYLETRKFDVLKYRVRHPKEMFQKAISIAFGKSNNQSRLSRSKKFNEFIKENIKLGERQYHYDIDFKNNPPQYEGIIVGSDQTWNPCVAGNPDCLYLTFVKEPTWKGTYAPSISVPKLTENQINRLKRLTNDIDYLSCREEDGSEIIRKCTGKEVHTVLDPTMLITTEEWEKYVKTAEKPSKYLLEYLLGDNKTHRSEIQKIAKKLNLEIVSLPYSYVDSDRKDGYFAGPGEFLDLIKNASLICTDSFHGTVFSIIFKRPILAFEKHKNSDKKSENSRIQHLLQMFGVEDRLYSSFESIDFEKIYCVDETKIEDNMKRLQNLSYDYLRDLLQNKGKSNKLSNINSNNIKNDCYSCFSCGYVCPSKAISFVELGGFFRPVVEEEKCFHCGKCNKECLIKNDSTKKMNGKAYIAFLNDASLRERSSSGGVFKAIADLFIENGDYVVGCVYDENFQPRHIVTDKRDIVDKMVGSKYVQSNLDGLYEEMYHLLSRGNKVLFSGLPCQVKAAHSLFSKFDNLTSICLVCHGVMPRNMWRQYIMEETEKNGEIVSCNMRDKRRGWTDYGLCFSHADGSENVVFRKTDGHLLKCYTDGLFENERCLSCGIKGSRIEADIIVGDGWSGNTLFPGIDDGKGISEVFSLTEKGNRWLSHVAEKMTIKECDFDVLYNDSPRLWSPENRQPNIEQFRKALLNREFDLHKDLRKYARPSLVQRFNLKLMRNLNVRK